MANRATTNVFELLSDEPTPVVKAEVVADKKPTQAASKEPIGSQKAATNRPAAAGSKPAAQSNGAVQGSTTGNPAPYRKERQEGRDRHTRDGRGRGRGGRGRDFDRHLSGTGRPPTENKKRGGGGHNWGKQQDEAWDAVPEATEEAKTDATTPAADTEAKPAEGEAPAAEKQEPVEPEPKQVSYEEYLAQKAQASKALAEKYNLKTDKRTVTDAADLKNVTVLDKKKEEAAEDATSAAGTQVRKDAGKVKDASHLLNFKVPVEERPSRGGRGRGGRGGSRGSGRGGAERGRGGRGGARGGGARPSSGPRQGGPQRGAFDATQVDDTAFPSLGAGKA